uniref:SANT domain-containing protein n=1 Tax=Meloidogyne javanica TaxID=6303 RepID=A0A915N697_MELJA
FSFVAELAQLRKQSSSSNRSHKASIFGNYGRMSIRHGGKLSLGAFTSPNDDFIRKMSSVSMEEQQSSESGDGVEKPPESDAIPHINLGKSFQARVKKWADRAISSEEREAIPDRDERLFNASSIEHISQQALAAYETLACSVALPKSGRNKELALHILAENRGNLQAAVMDLLRCDTLDWEQYPAIYNSRYVDVDDWSPEEIASFQDAIYKSEKDFQQVSSELGNRSVYECVAFYYTWKKACPDDYRKLRNLRRKRQLLEQQLDLASFDTRQQQLQKHPMKRMRCGIDNLITNSGEDENELLRIDGKQDEELSETESDITNPSLLNVKGQHGAAVKKGAQPQADGFFHCRLCEKR